MEERPDGDLRELLATLREREQLLDRLARIQRSIVSRTALDEVLDSIVERAAELLQDEVVALRLIKADDPGHWQLAGSRGIPPDVRAKTAEGRVGEGCGGLAISEGELVVVEDYANDPRTLPAYVADGVQAGMAAPVREHGEVVGSLLVATHSRGRRYSQAEREILLAFAEHASLALNDARTVRDAIHEALHDSLTGLPNRSLLLDRLEQALARARRGDDLVVLMFCDLDDFKTINDSLGHAAGDDLLIAAGKRLADCVRPGDTVARFGGDEFVLLFENLDRSELTGPAERIHRAMQMPFPIRGREIVVGASVGIASRGESAEEMLRNADLALYKAKSAGKARYALFEPGMHVAMIERLELESELRLGIRRGELRLLYQPIVRLLDGSIVGVEALVRWRHPERGMLSPASFIPLAEDSGLIVPLGRWVLEEACRQAAEWQGALGHGVSPGVSVNISGVELAQAGLRSHLATVLAETRIDPSQLMIELTETALMQDLELAVTRLEGLKALGLRLAIDDFGTGYASLQHLRRFPVDVIKIAKPFIDDVAGGPEQSALARAVVDLGSSFSLRVVAEGIETSPQHDRLVALGCDLGQGYLFSRPVGAAEMTAALADQAEGRPATRLLLPT